MFRCFDVASTASCICVDTTFSKIVNGKVCFFIYDQGGEQLRRTVQPYAIYPCPGTEGWPSRRGGGNLLRAAEASSLSVWRSPPSAGGFVAGGVAVSFLRRPQSNQRHGRHSCFILRGQPRGYLAGGGPDLHSFSASENINAIPGADFQMHI